MRVTVDLAKEAASFASADTRFWVVRPRISAGEVSGLGTLFSGAYIGTETIKWAKVIRSANIKLD